MKSLSVAAGMPRLNQVVTVQEPDVGQYPAFGRHGTVVVVAPGGDVSVRVDDDPLVESEQQARDDEAGHDERRQHLVRGDARRLHRDDLAVLVERGEGDERPQQDGEGQEA